MRKEERILDLLAMFLEARSPLPFRALRAAFPEEYGQGNESADLRKFERDKAQLALLGLGLNFIEGEDGGYVLDRETAFLPKVTMSQASWTWLYAAGAAALGSEVFLGREDLAHAMRKIAHAVGLPANPRPIDFGFTVGAQTPQTVSAHLDVLWWALRQRKSVRLSYQSPHSGQSLREVFVYGLCLRRGRWHCVAWCNTRQAIRTFLVHRIESVTANERSPKKADYSIPADFRFDDFVPRWPWQQFIHAPIAVTLSIRGSLIARVGELFPGSAVQNLIEHTRVELQATDVDALCRMVLAAGHEAAVVSPTQVRARWLALAEAVAAQHQEAR